MATRITRTVESRGFAHHRPPPRLTVGGGPSHHHARSKGPDRLTQPPGGGAGAGPARNGRQGSAPVPALRLPPMVSKLACGAVRNLRDRGRPGTRWVSTSCVGQRLRGVAGSSVEVAKDNAPHYRIRARPRCWYGEADQGTNGPRERAVSPHLASPASPGARPLRRGFSRRVRPRDRRRMHHGRRLQPERVAVLRRVAARRLLHDHGLRREILPGRGGLHPVLSGRVPDAVVQPVLRRLAGESGASGEVPPGCAPGSCTETLDQCTADEIALERVCAPRSTERRFCAKSCGSNADCRGGYECRLSGTRGSLALTSSVTSTARFWRPSCPEPKPARGRSDNRACDGSSS